MFTVKELRNRHGWNLSQLGRATGLDRRYLADLERGVTLATPQVRELLSQHGLTALPCTTEVLRKKDLRALPLRPYEYPQYNLEAWDRAAASKPGLYRRIDPKCLAWLRRFVRADSILECDLWVRLLLAGGTRRWANPHECGYRNLPVVDDLGDALGERKLPCIHLKRNGLEVIIWPQVWLRPGKFTFRVDALVLRILPTPHWGALEVDGPGHDFEKDDFRSEQLGQDTIRLNKSDIQNPELVEVVIQRILGL